MLFANSVDPRRYSITTYASSDGPIFADVNRSHPGQIKTFPFASSRALNAPQIEFNASPSVRLTALLDTSSPRSWIDLSTSRALRARPLNPGDEAVPWHITNSVPGFASVVETLRLDNLNIESALVYIRAAKSPLNALARGAAFRPPDLVIGIDMLAAFEYVSLDFPLRQITFSATDPYQPRTARLLAELPVEYVHGMPAARGMIDEQPTVILIDSLGDFPMAVPAEAEEPLRQVTLGDLVLRQVAAVTCDDAQLGLPTYPRVGRGVLSRFKVTLAEKGHRLYIERPAAP